MLWARCVSDAVRAVCPEVTAGLYAPEEVMDFESIEVVEPESVTKPAMDAGKGSAQAPAVAPKPAAAGKKTAGRPPGAKNKKGEKRDTPPDEKQEPPAPKVEPASVAKTEDGSQPDPKMNYTIMPEGKYVNVSFTDFTESQLNTVLKCGRPSITPFHIKVIETIIKEKTYKQISEE